MRFDRCPATGMVESLNSALTKFEDLHEGGEIGEQYAVIALANFVTGAVLRQPARLREAARLFVESARLPWRCIADEVWPEVERESGDVVQPKAERGTGSLHMSHECFWAACRSAERAGDLTQWELVAGEWFAFAPSKSETAREMARCFKALGQYEQATNWEVKAFDLEGEEPDALEATHFLQLATASRLDRLGHALSITARGLAPWVERRLRPIFKDAWRRSGQAATAQQAGETPDVIELHRLVSRNKSVFGQRAEQLLAPLNRLAFLRNHWAHQQRIGLSEIQRGLSDAAEVLRVVGAPETSEIAALIDGLS